MKIILQQVSQLNQFCQNIFSLPTTSPFCRPLEKVKAATSARRTHLNTTVVWVFSIFGICASCLRRRLRICVLSLEGRKLPPLLHSSNHNSGRLHLLLVSAICMQFLGLGGWGGCVLCFVRQKLSPLLHAALTEPQR